MTARARHSPTGAATVASATPPLPEPAVLQGLEGRRRARRGACLSRRSRAVRYCRVVDNSGAVSVDVDGRLSELRTQMLAQRVHYAKAIGTVDQINGDAGAAFA